ncbi:MAG: ribosome maturation factor RimM [Erysipelotrichaceae bacterium]
MKQINIGVIANTHGIKGDLKVKPLTDFVEQRFARGAEVFVQQGDKSIPFTVRNIRESKGMLLVTFKGFEDINQVEQYKGCYITVNVEDLHELESDEIYHHELMGCEVMSEDGRYLGKVTEIIATGANDIIRVVDEAEKGILIPYVKSFILTTDAKTKKITVRLLEGME